MGNFCLSTFTLIVHLGLFLLISFVYSLIIHFLSLLFFPLPAILLFIELIMGSVFFFFFLSSPLLFLLFLLQILEIPYHPPFHSSIDLGDIKVILYWLRKVCFFFSFFFVQQSHRNEHLHKCTL